MSAGTETVDEPTMEDRPAARQLSRRIDWRFLMDDPRLGHVVYDGPEPGTLRPALRRQALSVTSLARVGAPRETDGEAPPADLAVLRQPGRRELRAARRALAGGGRLYCELDRRAGLSALLPSVGRAPDDDDGGRDSTLLWGEAGALLRDAGFTDLRAHLHYPSFEECREIVPLEAPALSLSLGRHLPWLPAGWGRVAGGLGARSLGRLAPYVSLLARAGGSAPAADGARPSWTGPFRPGPSALAVTPRFRASAHVVLLVPDADGRRPERVVKVARRADRSEPLAREAANLRKVQEARPGGFDSIPRLEATGRVDGTAFLVESGLGGRPMDRSYVRRRPGASVDAVAGWLRELHRATVRRVRPREQAYRRLVTRPLERLARTVPLDGEDGELLAATRRLARPLRREAWPTVFEHGDLCHPNLLWDPDRGPGVVDWERANPEGLPAADLFFFLAYVAVARRRAADREGYVGAFDDAFLRPSRYGEEAVDRYAAGLDISPPVLRALFAVCWPRQLARVVGALAPEAADRGDRLAPEAAAWIRRHRFFVFWRRAVREAERLRLGGGGSP